MLISSSTPGPLYNMLHYNTDLDITDHYWTPVSHLTNRLFLLYVYTFYSIYNTDWIANMEINLDSNNSVIKRLRWII